MAKNETSCDTEGKKQTRWTSVFAVVDDVGENINSLRLLIESQEFYIENLKGGKKLQNVYLNFDERTNSKIGDSFYTRFRFLDDASFSFKQL